jgi:hypothetical protein
MKNRRTFLVHINMASRAVAGSKPFTSIALASSYKFEKISSLNIGGIFNSKVIAFETLQKRLQQKNAYSLVSRYLEFIPLRHRQLFLKE